MQPKDYAKKAREFSAAGLVVMITGWVLLGLTGLCFGLVMVGFDFFVDKRDLKYLLFPLILGGTMLSSGYSLRQCAGLLRESATERESGSQ